MRPSSFPSFVYRQDGYELSYFTGLSIHHSPGFVNKFQFIELLKIAQAHLGPHFEEGAGTAQAVTGGVVIA